MCERKFLFIRVYYQSFLCYYDFSIKKASMFVMHEEIAGPIDVDKMTLTSQMEHIYG